MTSPQEQIAQLAKSSQEAVTEAVRAWAENVQAFAGSLLGTQPRLPSAVEVVDNVFDFAEQLLANQREFAKSLLTASVQATEAASARTREATDKVVEQVVKSTEAATGKAGQAAERATARSARNSA